MEHSTATLDILALQHSILVLVGRSQLRKAMVGRHGSCSDHNTNFCCIPTKNTSHPLRNLQGHSKALCLIVMRPCLTQPRSKRVLVNPGGGSLQWCTYPRDNWEDTGAKRALAQAVVRYGPSVETVHISVSAPSISRRS